jgi:hypothetical protein
MVCSKEELNTVHLGNGYKFSALYSAMLLVGVYIACYMLKQNGVKCNTVAILLLALPAVAAASYMKGKCQNTSDKHSAGAMMMETKLCDNKVMVGKLVLTALALTGGWMMYTGKQRLIC